MPIAGDVGRRTISGPKPALSKPQAANAGELFGLTKSETAMPNEVPMRGLGTPMPPTDQLICRFTEMAMVNGPAWNALIMRKFGDGIMGEAISTWRDGTRRQACGRPRQDHDERQISAV